MPFSGCGKNSYFPNVLVGFCSLLFKTRFLFLVLQLAGLASTPDSAAYLLCDSGQVA